MRSPATGPAARQQQQQQAPGVVAGGGSAGQGGSLLTHCWHKPTDTPAAATSLTSHSIRHIASSIMCGRGCRKRLHRGCQGDRAVLLERDMQLWHTFTLSKHMGIGQGAKCSSAGQGSGVCCGCNIVLPSCCSGAAAAAVAQAEAWRLHCSFNLLHMDPVDTRYPVGLTDQLSWLRTASNASSTASAAAALTVVVTAAGPLSGRIATA